MSEKLPVLDPCPKCKGPACILPAVKRGLFIASCRDFLNCAFSPVTEPFPSEVEASDAWNRREFMHYTPAAIAAAE